MKTQKKQVEKPTNKKTIDWTRFLDLSVGSASIVGLVASSAYGLRKLFEAMPETLSVGLTFSVSLLLIYAMVRFIVALRK